MDRAGLRLGNYDRAAASTRNIEKIKADPVTVPIQGQDSYEQPSVDGSIAPDQPASRSTPIPDTSEEPFVRSPPSNRMLFQKRVSESPVPPLRVLMDTETLDHLDIEREEEPDDSEEEEPEEPTAEQEPIQDASARNASGPSIAISENQVDLDRDAVSTGKPGAIPLHPTPAARIGSMPPPSTQRTLNERASSTPPSFVRRLMLLQQSRHAPAKPIWKAATASKRLTDFEVVGEGLQVPNKRRRVDPLEDHSNVTIAPVPVEGAHGTVEKQMKTVADLAPPILALAKSVGPVLQERATASASEEEDMTKQSLGSEKSPPLPPKRALPHFDTPGESIHDLLTMANAVPTTPYDGHPSTLRAQRRTTHSVGIPRRTAQTGRGAHVRASVPDNGGLPSWAKAVQPRSVPNKLLRPSLTNALGATSALIPHIDFTLPPALAVSMIRRDMDGSPIRDGQQAREAASRTSLVGANSPRRFSLAPKDTRQSHQFEIGFGSDSFGSPIARGPTRPKTPRSSLLARSYRPTDPFVDG